MARQVYPHLPIEMAVLYGVPASSAKRCAYARLAGECAQPCAEHYVNTFLFTTFTAADATYNVQNREKIVK